MWVRQAQWGCSAAWSRVPTGRLSTSSNIKRDACLKGCSLLVERRSRHGSILLIGAACGRSAMKVANIVLGFQRGIINALRFCGFRPEEVAWTSR